MGEFYLFLPLDSTIVEWLAQCSIVAPKTFSARHPTPLEIRQAATLPRYRLIETGPTPLGHWHLEVEAEFDPEHSPWAFITVHPFRGQDAPSPTTFERGRPEVILPIALSLVRSVGPHVLQPGSGEAPILLEAHTTLAQALERWARWS